MPSDRNEREVGASSGRSSEIPEPLRAVAGLAATVLNQARLLPATVAGLPVKVAGIAMQTSLRLQQHYAGLVVKGDELLTQITRSDDGDPPWATFDDDVVEVAESVTDGLGLDTTAKGWTGTAAAEVALPPLPGTTRTRPKPVASRPPKMGTSPSAFDLAEDPSGEAIRPAKAAAKPARSPRAGKRASAVAPVPGYDTLTLAQLRARLRTFDSATLNRLLIYERDQRARVPYLTLLENRLNRGRQQG